MEKDELIGKLSNFIRKEKFQEINEIIKKFKDEKIMIWSVFLHKLLLIWTNIKKP